MVKQSNSGFKFSLPLLLKVSGPNFIEFLMQKTVLKGTRCLGSVELVFEKHL